MRHRTVTYSRDSAFNALADPTRRAVLDLLRAGTRPAGEIARAFPISRPAISGDGAVIYLEYHGGARAYHLVRSAGRWSADWYVDLWQCG